MWTEELKRVANEKLKYNEKINNGASIEELSRFGDEVRRVFGHDVPEEYTVFLRMVNGIEFNSYIIYGIDNRLTESERNQLIIGFIEQNNLWRENKWDKDYLFLGESDISWFVYDLQDNKYYELDKPSGWEVETYNSFSDLADRVLSASLL